MFDRKSFWGKIWVETGWLTAWIAFGTIWCGFGGWWWGIGGCAELCCTCVVITVLGKYPPICGCCGDACGGGALFIIDRIATGFWLFIWFASTGAKLGVYMTPWWNWDGAAGPTFGDIMCGKLCIPFGWACGKCMLAFGCPCWSFGVGSWYWYCSGMFGRGIVWGEPSIGINRFGSIFSGFWYCCTPAACIECDGLMYWLPERRNRIILASEHIKIASTQHTHLVWRHSVVWIIHFIW